jgi:hypothetical protein
MPRITDPKLHGLWRDRIRRQLTSVLIVPQFCASEGIPRSKFHAWKRRFRLAIAAEQRRAFPARSTCLPVMCTAGLCRAEKSVGFVKAAWASD